MKKLVISIIMLLSLFLMNSVSVMAVTQEQITSQQNQVNTLVQEISQLDNQINTYESQIQTLNQQIEQTIQELFDTQTEEAELKEANKGRIRAAYMYGTESYLECLFSAQTPSDFISYYDVAKDILQADKSSLEELKNKQEEIKKLQEQRVNDRNNLLNAKRQAESTRAAKSQLLNSNRDLVTQLQDLMRQQNALNQQNSTPAPTIVVTPAQQQSVGTQRSNSGNVQSLNDSPDQSIGDTTQASGAVTLPSYAAEDEGTDQIVDDTNKPADTTQNPQNTYQDWFWPIDTNAPNAFLITSMMGTRESPGGIGSTDHHGTDIGADYGSAILAAQSGTVVKAENSGGYGNVVVIDHGNGYFTTYGHMSTIAVSAGQQVYGGQIIGYVGSTGWSTGPHLHFEVHYYDDDGTDNLINGLSLYGQDVLDKLSYQE